MTMKKIW
jgi:hypothetical protein